MLKLLVIQLLYPPFFISKFLFMSVNHQIFERIQTILHEKFYYSYEEIESKIYFEKELALDSHEMRELLKEFELTFNIVFSYTGMSNFYF